MNKQLIQNEQGAAALIVLVILIATVVIALGATMVGTMDTRLSGNYRDGLASLYAAEGGIHNAIRELRLDNEWNAGFSDIALNNGATYDVTVSKLGTYEAKINAIGHYDKTQREIEVVINTDSAFAHAVNVGGDLSVYASPIQADQGLRANGNILLELQATHPTVDVYNPNPDNNLTIVGRDQGVESHTVDELDVDAVRLSTAEWETLASAASSGYYYDDDGTFGSKDMNVTLSNFDCDTIPANSAGQHTVFVDGNLTLLGDLDGSDCVFITTGSIRGGDGTGDNLLNAGRGNHVGASFLAAGDIIFDFTINSTNEVEGLLYTESDYEVSGKVFFNGVVTALGNAVLGKETDWGNGNPKIYWHQYGSIPTFASLLDEIDIISWREKHLPMG